MKDSNKYRIAFRGLSNGKHEYSWTIDKSFFEGFSNSEILNSELNVRLILTKSDRLFELDFNFSGIVSVACDRCLDELQIPIESKQSVYARESSKSAEDSDDVIFIDPNDYEFDLSQTIYDYVMLSLPMRRVHAEGECNAEMINRICTFSEESVQCNLFKDLN